MPLYEYRCTHCSNHAELLQKFSDAPAKTCPHCHKDGLVKQISVVGFQLKGSGWYATDFKDKKPTQTTSHSDQATDKTPEKPTEKSTEKAQKAVDKSE